MIAPFLLNYGMELNSLYGFSQMIQIGLTTLKEYDTDPHQISAANKTGDGNASGVVMESRAFRSLPICFFKNQDVWKYRYKIQFYVRNILHCCLRRGPLNIFNKLNILCVFSEITKENQIFPLLPFIEK